MITHVCACLCSRICALVCECRGLLDDKYFIDAIKRVKMEPVPYFIQFRNSVVASKVDSPVKSPGLPSSDDGIIGSHSERTEDMATKHIVLADAMVIII